MANFVQSRGDKYDIILSKREISENSYDSYFEYNQTQGSLISNFPEIDYIFPRIYAIININGSWLRLIATDLKAEQNKGIGFSSKDDNETGDDLNKIDSLLENGCIISDRYKSFNYKKGDILNFSLLNSSLTLNFTFVDFYDIEDKYPYGEYFFPEILVDINVFRNLATNYSSITGNSFKFEWKDLCNRMIIGLKDSFQYYKVTDIDNSLKKMANIAGEIRIFLGFDEWAVDYGGTRAFSSADEVFVALIVVVSIGIFAGFLFYAIITYNLLSTSISERLREIGILQSIGAKKSQIFYALVTEGFLLGIASVVLGFIISLLFNQFVIVPIVNIFLEGMYEFIIQPQMLLIACSISFGTIFVFSIIPARYIYKFQIIQLIRPETLVETSADSNTGSNKDSNKKNGMDLIKYVVMLLILSLIYLIFPIALNSKDVFVIFGFVIVIFFIAIIGLVMISTIFIKPLSKGFLKIYERINLKFKVLLQLGLNKHLRRNKVISVILILSFSIAFFFISSLRMMNEQTRIQTECLVGSDINIYSRGETYVPLQQFQINDLMSIEGIESVSGVVHDLYRLENTYLKKGIYSSPLNLKLEISDSFSIQRSNNEFFAVDSNFNRTIYHESIQMNQGTFEDAFSKIFNIKQVNILISTEISEYFQTEKDEYLNLYFTRNGKTIQLKAQVSGVYHAIPGAFHDYNAYDFQKKGTFIISMDTLQQYFSLPKGDNGVFTRLLIKQSNNANSDAVKSNIQAYFGKDWWGIYYLTYEDEYNDRAFYSELALIIGILLCAMLFFMIIAGFNSSFYSVFIERQKEIMIYRALGLSLKDIKILFQKELMILLLINGALGSLIGLILAVLFGNLSTIMYHVPIQIAIPIDIIVLLLVFCAGILYVFYNHLFKKKLKPQIMSLQVRQ
jgi:ABC-type lipoprotein release transport system permease subunit